MKTVVCARVYCGVTILFTVSFRDMPEFDVTKTFEQCKIGYTRRTEVTRRLDHCQH